MTTAEIERPQIAGQALGSQEVDVYVQRAEELVSGFEKTITSFFKRVDRTLVSAIGEEYVERAERTIYSVTTAITPTEEDIIKAEDFIIAHEPDIRQLIQTTPEGALILGTTEFISGENLITGEPLPRLERASAGVGAGKALLKLARAA